MDGSENRHLARDSLFLMADLRVDGLEGQHRIKVRNLSSGGMMGEGPIRVVRGAVVAVNIRNLGWIDGAVAWVQDTRFGISFRDEIDPKIAREQLTAAKPDDLHSPRFTRPPLHKTTGRGNSTVRKI
ncbi:MAG TPA: PilZ domain-containing protein [Novosphingobium sp.]|nr:PilZ domain-containing protein [Novosphingobium sp.]